MVHAAILSAEEVIGACFCRLKPLVRISSGQHIGLESERRNVEGVDGIFGCHYQSYLPANGYVEFVDFALSGRMLDLPHPLLPDNVDLTGTIWFSCLLEINLRSPNKNTHCNEERNYGPKGLEPM